MIARSIVTFRVADVDRSIKFYVETLGFKLRHRADEPGSAWAEVDGPGVTLGLQRGAEQGATPGAHESIRVELVVDQPLEDVVAVLENRGVRFLGPMVESPVRSAAFGDPDGNELCLSEERETG